ncbi:50S ribosomal protein L32 [Patescibacteria group bacterium]|nr:50S ribosomal protein L32 [Patescibacteria group bacterium]MBU2472527.1 50S ribosomal protein L32 [Patescibacteria group bacterium]
MPVPKQRHTKSRRNKRRSHHALKKKALFTCPKCKELVLPHCLCESCGTYKGKEMIDVLSKLDKKERKKKEKEMAAQEKLASPGGEQSKEKELSMQDLSKK